MRDTVVCESKQYLESMKKPKKEGMICKIVSDIHNMMVKLSSNEKRIASLESRISSIESTQKVIESHSLQSIEQNKEILALLKSGRVKEKAAMWDFVARIVKNKWTWIIIVASILILGTGFVELLKNSDKIATLVSAIK